MACRCMVKMLTPPTSSMWGTQHTMSRDRGIKRGELSLMMVIQWTRRRIAKRLASVPNCWSASKHGHPGAPISLPLKMSSLEPLMRDDSCGLIGILSRIARLGNTVASGAKGMAENLLDARPELSHDWPSHHTDVGVYFRDDWHLATQTVVSVLPRRGQCGRACA